MGKYVVGAVQRRWSVCGFDLTGNPACKEIRYGRDALMGRPLCNLSGWVDPLHTHTLGLERLEQRAVIAADFHNKTVFGYCETRNNRSGILAEVLHQSQRNRRAIGIFPEQDFGIYDIKVLQVTAIKTEITIERIDLLLFLQALLAHEGIADSGRKDRENQLKRAGSAQAAGRLTRHMLHLPPMFLRK